MADNPSSSPATAPDVDDPQQQIAMLKQQLAQAQKSAALGELLSTTTHEFNNVLMSILNYAKMGLRQRDDAARNRAFDKILDASRRAEKITKTILGVARNRSGEMEPTDLVKLIDGSLVLLEREMYKYRISVEKQFDPVPPALVCGNQIQQVLINLLVNARQAMREGGRLIIRLGHDEKAGTVDLTVRDTGTGIPPDQLPRIFDSYFTTKSGPDATGKGGTGLGLSACRDIIEAHRGRIRVQSTVGRGTAFTIKLPVAPPKVPVAAPIAAPIVTPTPQVGPGAATT